MREAGFYMFNAFLFMILFTGCASLPQKESDEAKNWKEKVEYYQLNIYMPQEYAAADSKYKEAKSMVEKKKNKLVLSLFNEAMQEFRTIFHEGMPLLLEVKKDEYAGLMQTAKELKVQVALKKDYESVVSTYEKAMKSLNFKAYEEAYTWLAQALATLSTVNDKAKMKKSMVSELIVELNKKLDEMERRIHDWETEE